MSEGVLSGRSRGVPSVSRNLPFCRFAHEHSRKRSGQRNLPFKILDPPLILSHSQHSLVPRPRPLQRKRVRWKWSDLLIVLIPAVLVFRKPCDHKRSEAKCMQHIKRKYQKNLYIIMCMHGCWFSTTKKSSTITRQLHITRPFWAGSGRETRPKNA